MTIFSYLRLSSEDNEGRDESESIVNQRNLLHDYIQKTPEFDGAEVVEFSDDGYSGKNFDRPGVQAMLAQIKQGKADCIIVKDLSRFGQDYITVGNYISKVFPFLGVRFIAVNDNFDSARKGDLDSLDRSFRALIYDFYSRDISKKVKTAKLRLVKRGININPVAPFGYQKDPKDKHRLIPDPKTADIVHRIFTLIAEGHTPEAVARAFNSEGVPPPSQFKAGTSSEHANWHNRYWNPAAVHRIARERQYVGALVYGKRVRPQIGAHQQLTTDESDRIIVDGCHESLVTQELFDKVQEQLGGVIRHFQPTPWDNPLKKKVYCGFCGYAIVRKGKVKHYYLCSRPNTIPGLGCCKEKVFEDDIIQAVTEAIRQQARCAVDWKLLHEQQQVKIGGMRRKLENQIQDCVTEQKMLAAEKLKLYEGFEDGDITREEYVRQKTEVTEKIKQAQHSEAGIREELAGLPDGESEYVDKYQALINLDCLSDEQMRDLLDRVTIFPEGRMEIRLRYLDGMSLPG